MIDKELFVVGVADHNTGYRMLHHVDEYDKVRITYDGLYNGAVHQGLDPNSIFLLPFPPDDEVVEKFKFTKEFLQWLNKETMPLIRGMKIAI